MPDIQITVRSKIAQTQGDPHIVCGNSDYTAVFDLDGEWAAYDVKTARFVWRDISTGKLRRKDVQLTGSTAALPAVYGTNQMLIGVYAGDIRTSTPANVPCLKAITEDDPAHDRPDDELYAQLLAYLEELDPSGGGGAPVDAVPVVDGAMLFTIGNAEIDSETVDLLTEPYASHLYNKWFDDYTGQVDDTARPNRVLCDLFIDIPDDRSSYTVQAAVSGSAGQFICYFYDANENFLSSQTVTSWVDSSTLNTIPNAKKLRVLMRLSSNADIAIGNISTFKVLFI